MRLSVSDIAGMLGGAVHGDAALIITGVNGVKEAGPGDLCFVRDAKYAALLTDSNAGAVLMDHVPEDCAKTIIVVSAPDLAFARILHAFEKAQTGHPEGIHPSAVVAPTARMGDKVALGPNVVISGDAVIGDGAILYPGVYVGRGVIIGPGTLIYPNVVIREACEIGARCILHSGAIIGSDGFGFAPIDGQWMKIPQVGRVLIEDDVEIGSNTAVDRATFGITRIGKGSKIDNLVQVGHNVSIGEHCAIAGQTGIAGSATLGDHVRIAAQGGVAGHLEIGAGVTVAGRGGVTKSIAAGAIVSGFPAKDHKEEMRITASLRWVPDLIRRVKQLERELHAMEERLNGQTTDHR